MIPFPKLFSTLPRPSILFLGYLEIAKLEQQYKQFIPTNRNGPFAINGITIVPVNLPSYAGYARNSDFNSLA